MHSESFLVCLNYQSSNTDSTSTYFTLTELLAPGHLMQQEIIYFVIHT